MLRRLLALLFLMWSIGFIIFAVNLPQAAGMGKTDSVVVLTGGSQRIDRGLAVLEAKSASRLLISGVDRNVKPAELAGQYQRSAALFDCCIDLGFQAVDTRSNALETARWVAKRKDKSVRLVTSDWHMRRAKLELERTLPNSVKIVTDAVQTQPSLSVLFREYNKYAMRRFAALLGV
ncbi:MAG: YdcF family protein [Parasphingorhabdus sp.]|nr:YdcF family protein [Parasphingorhabdus sp.]